MKKEKINTDKIESGFSSALAGQLIAKGFTPVNEKPTVGESSPVPANKELENKVVAGVNFAKIEKLVLRREKKGRGGKTVTVVSGFNMQSARLEDLSRTMRKALGCGSTVEEGTIVLQGDITDRTRTWLEKQGAKKVIVGN
jgi:predicted translation initiation factor SUI1